MKKKKVNIRIVLEVLLLLVLIAFICDELNPLKWHWVAKSIASIAIFVSVVDFGMSKNVKEIENKH